ncbi:histidine--tRNA ligase [Lichenihabitans sp. PAMC28606]|uniref:histidine--tRNA ligase n=1 Tax=Lichenihabitans sp. PAMC28606 TaxID=2880932 RepID=UPI001D0B506D|nr:histidine--tRNA ligase [Lichenihabitans sp. PAMC28606]UDL94969.1 histidine--tRNA ligase [Lichenihabitans sp. PAMC28606]
MSTDAPANNETVKPRLPRGLIDRGPLDLAATDRMLSAIRENYALYGFEAVETPLIEYTDALGKFLPDLDRPNEGVFSFKDDDEAWLSLRYDLTAPLARYVAQNYDALPKPYRSFRVGQVFRNEKPGPGRFRQFMQFDADTVGSASVAADAEMCVMAAVTLEKLGIPRGDYRVKVNNRKVLDGVMEAAGLGAPDQAGRRLTVLRAIDKLDRLGPNGVRALLGSGRRDESGDFTKGAGLDEAAIATILAFTEAGTDTNDATLVNLAEVVAGSARGQEGVAELREIAALVVAAGCGEDQVILDPSVVRGLEYYTGPVFEADLTFTVQGEDGKPVRFGSVGGGGRYDGLVARFRNEPVPATGFSIGVSRLFAALKAVGSPIVVGGPAAGPVVVLVLDKDQLPHYQGLVTRLREAGVRAELYLGQSGMNAQLKYADKRASVCAVIQGSNERQAEGGATVMIRDLVLGAELAKGSKDRDDYLDLRQKAQFPVLEADLVTAVQEVLARHA